MKKSEEQEIFNRVVAHLRKQGIRSYSAHTGCRYRLNVGDVLYRCAIGCLIDDEHYSTSFEGKPADMAGVLEAVKASTGFDITDRDGMFLQKLQWVHDRNRPSEWEKELIEVAFDYELEMPQ